ncbi:testis-specific serine/threonine-protein kinase 3-like [Hetaerina americana]|uniref:testis-specific serine/threonine-protein kinase 3-like n=1 Tax=Hetaerina americana TaxID=62018 RepID=UPI003A7F27A1
MKERLSGSESSVTEVPHPAEPQPNSSPADENTVEPESTLEIPSLPKRLSILETHGYTIGRTIGNGSYASVKLAYSERHGCNVAIKIVAKYNAPSDYLTKFLPREIDVVKGLAHPNIIHFMQAIETTHRVYIIMEYAENGSLLDIVRRFGHVDEVRARKWFKQLADAIYYCHERGIVHRDIKCENLLMDHDCNIKLSDFGFARTVPEPFGMGLCETFCGSYAYASPEVLRGIPYQPKHSDVWSMGVVLFAMVYGRLPFDDSHYNHLLKQIQRKVQFFVEPEVSSSCKELISQILAPLRVRLQLPEILNNPWLNEEPESSRLNTKIVDSGAISWRIDELQPGRCAKVTSGDRSMN